MVQYVKCEKLHGGEAVKQTYSLAALTCEMGQGVRQTAEFIVAQVEFLQTGDQAQAAG